MALRHRRPREAGHTPRRDRDARGRSAAAAGPRRPCDGASQPSAGADHRGSLVGALAVRLGLQAGDRPGDERAQRNEGYGGFECGERASTRAAAGLRKDLCAVRRSHHRPQRRHRRPDQCRVNDDFGPGALSHGGHSHPPRLRGRPRDLLTRGAARHLGDDHAR